VRLLIVGDEVQHRDRQDRDGLVEVQRFLGRSQHGARVGDVDLG
jgi:hypothetical protein